MDSRSVEGCQGCDVWRRDIDTRSQTVWLGRLFIEVKWKMAGEVILISKGSVSPPGNDIYGVKCHAGS